MYETPHDLKEEERVARALALAWNCKMVKPSEDLATYDRAAYRDGILLATIEIKCRDRWYPRMLLSARKFVDNLDHMIATGVQHVVVFAVGTEVRYHRADETLSYLLTVGGRRDRHDARDMELCVYLDTQSMAEMSISSHKEDLLGDCD